MSKPNIIVFVPTFPDLSWPVLTCPDPNGVATWNNWKFNYSKFVLSLAQACLNSLENVNYDTYHNQLNVHDVCVLYDHILWHMQSYRHHCKTCRYILIREPDQTNHIAITHTVRWVIASFHWNYSNPNFWVRMVQNVEKLDEVWFLVD